VLVFGARSCDSRQRRATSNDVDRTVRCCRVRKCSLIVALTISSTPASSRLLPRPPLGLYGSSDESSPDARYARAQRYSVEASRSADRARSTMTARGERVPSSSGAIRSRRRRASAQSRSSTLLRSGNDGTGEGAGKTGLRSTTASRTSSSVSMSRATTKSKPMSCIIMKRRPPHSTSAPSLIERLLTGAHDHPSPSIQRTPSRILFAPFWRLLYVSRILFAISHQALRYSQSMWSQNHRCNRSRRWMLSVRYIYRSSARMYMRPP
jgi:hypothetical protein